MRHVDACYTYDMFNIILYCVSYECLRMDVYFPLHTFRFPACIYCLFHNCMIWYVYMLYSMYSPRGGNKIYLSIYLSGQSIKTLKTLKNSHPSVMSRPAKPGS